MAHTMSSCTHAVIARAPTPLTAPRSRGSAPAPACGAGSSSPTPSAFMGMKAPLRAHPAAARTHRAPYTIAPVKASNLPPPDPMFGGPDPEKDEAGGFDLGNFLGNYALLALWGSVLALAAVKGYGEMIKDPANGGMLVGPPTAFLILVASFSIYWTFKGEDERKDAGKDGEDAS
mmetsp:Transcript_47114/g.151031  ORF Transcript_47114/g.151031 Transcript_47114/m.151031 type:complete len:175 (+) Transcript_47114:104-628(+)